MAGRIEVGCGHFADELRQSRVFWPVVLPRELGKMRVSAPTAYIALYAALYACLWCGLAVLAKIFRNQSSDPGTDRCDTGGCVAGAPSRRSAFRCARRFPAIVAPCARILCGRGSRDGRR